MDMLGDHQISLILGGPASAGDVLAFLLDLQSRCHAAVPELRSGGRFKPLQVRFT